MPTPDILSLRQLNRATLARQLLLARAHLSPVAAIEQVFGLQAQLPRPSFVGLWSRIEGVDRGRVIRLLLERSVVRATTMRATLHLLSASDFLRFREPLQAALDRAALVLSDRADGLEMERLVEHGRTFFAKPRTFDAFRDHLETRYPNGDIRAMAYAVRTRLPLVQVPDEGAAWGFPSQAAFVTADAWMGKARAAKGSVEEIVLRYLGAFGPASVADVQAWSGLQRLKPVVEKLRPTLRTFKLEGGRTELFDLPDARRPDPDTAVPVRFLPEWDNAIVARADARCLAQEHRPAVFKPGLRVLATVLVDGFVAGTWTIERKARAAALTVESFAPLARRVRTEIEEEGTRLVHFVEPDAERTSVVVR